MQAVQKYVSLRRYPWDDGAAFKVVAMRAPLYVDGQKTRFQCVRYRQAVQYALESPVFVLNGSDAFRVIRASWGDPARFSQRYEQSVARTRSRVFEYAMCNSWDYFITITVDPAKHDRNDFKGTKAKLSKWLNNFKFRWCPDLRYMLVPEYHEDGAIHFHGMIAGIASDQLSEFRLGDPMSNWMATQIGKGRLFFNLPKLANDFGFCSLSPVRHHEACAKYITKYVTADLMRMASGMQILLVSKGLNKSDVVFKGSAPEIFDYMWDDEFDAFENEFCRIKWASDSDGKLSFVGNE